MVLGAQPSIFWFWLTWQIFPDKDLIFYLAFPFFFVIGVLILIIGSTLIAKIFLMITNLFHHPREGVFERDKKDKDYCYWSLRAVIRKWPIWLARQLSLPFIEKLIVNILGIKIKYSSAIHDAWVDCEFVEIGKNVKVGQGTLIMSNILVQNKLIIKKIIINDSVIIGSHCAISPGTIIESGVVMHSNTMTIVNQCLKKDSLYRGGPAEIFGSNNEITGEKEIRAAITSIKPENNIDKDSFLKAHTKELSVPFQFYIISGIFIAGFSFVGPAILFYPFFFGFVIPFIFNNPFNLAIFSDWTFYFSILLIPIGFIIIYLVHLFFIVLFTRWFYRLTDKRGPDQGIFDRDMEISSTKLDYYHFGSFLMKYPIFAVSRSPFPWLLNWELNFINSNRIERGTILEETFIHSHVNFGKNSYLGTTSHVTNHLVDGVYGQENLTFVGVKIGDNCIFNTHTGGLPGSEIGNNSTFMPGATTIKYDKILGNGIYGGFPVKKLSKEEILALLGGEYDGK
jgi:acetyltransferase-like isoleucine patch superfamily enzyme